MKRKRFDFFQKKKLIVLLVVGLIALFFVLVLITITNKKGANEVGQTPKSSALHLFHDDVTLTNPAGQAESGDAIPKEVINNDFTIRVAIKNGEYNHSGGSNIISIQGNTGKKRFEFFQDSSPISNIRISDTGINNYKKNDGTPDNETIELHNKTLYPGSGTRSQETYDDYYIVYKKPLAPVEGNPGQSGYFRLYRSLDDNTSVIPLVFGSDSVICEINIPPSNFDWKDEADSAFKIVVGDSTNIASTIETGTSNTNKGQDLKITELTMWRKALDADMNGSSGTYIAQYNKYNGGDHSHIKYTSETINNLTKKPLLDNSETCFHFGDSDAGLTDNKWVNTSQNSPLCIDNIDLSLSGASSLTSDVPDWTNSNYPVSSKELPTVDPAQFTREVLSKSSVKLSAIPLGSANGNAETLPLKRTVYISSSESEYKYTTVYKEKLSPGQIETTISNSNIDTEKYRYYATIEWTDKLENTKVITLPVTDQPEYVKSPNTQSLHLTESENNRVARTNLPYKLPINQPVTFRLLFKLNQLPIKTDTDLPVFLFGLYDCLNNNAGYQVMNVSATKSGNNTVAQFRIFDGDKYLKFVLDGANGYLTKDTWEEFWFSFERPTSTNEGSLYVYRYKKDTNQLLTVYNNTIPIPKVESWFSDWNFKKWESRIFFGNNANTGVGADFNINQATWWTKQLSQNEIANIAGYNIEDLPSELKLSDSLFWNLTPSITGSAISGISGTSSAVYNLEPKCYTGTSSSTTETNCVSVSDTPSFLGYNEASISITMPTNKIVYAGKAVNLSATVLNATNLKWSATGPTGAVINFSADTSNMTNFSADLPGTYTISLTANDLPDTHTATRSLTVEVRKLGDINNSDGLNMVNSIDFFALLANWGIPTDPMADIIVDGKVDSQDFFALLANWG